MAFHTSSTSAQEPSQSIVIPTYNESERIDRTIETAVTYLTAQPYESELLIVNDGSSDATSAKAHAWADKWRMVRVVDIPHSGKAVAVRRGVEAATGDIIAFTDADLATPLEFIKPFRASIAGGYDVVIGSREGTGSRRIGEPALRHVMGRVFNGLVRVTLLPGIQDTQCGFKMFTREAALDLFATSRLYPENQKETTGPRVTAFDVELLVIAKRRGYAIKIIPVTWTFGENSKVSAVSDTITNLRDVLTVKLNDLRGLYD